MNPAKVNLDKKFSPLQFRCAGQQNTEKGKDESISAMENLILYHLTCKYIWDQMEI